MANNQIELFQQVATPMQEIMPEVFQRQGIRLFIKRDDMLHPDISGNKWRKLKYNLLEAKQLGYYKLLTFGGAFSNHLAATAAAGQAFNFSTVGIIRGEKVLPLNPTLRYAEECGMELKFVSRASYSSNNKITLLKELEINFTDYYILPEGGSNCLALKGVAELVSETFEQIGYLPDYLCTACGTGATLAGLVTGMKEKGQVLGIPVLKGGFMKNEVEGFLEKCNGHSYKNWEVMDDYHFGGYAKFKTPLIQFINDFKKQFTVPLDPIYTGKLAYGLFDMAEKQFFKKNTTVIMLHTGGLQGVAGFNERFGELIT